MQVEDIRSLIKQVSSTPSEKFVVEMCFISLVAYFEGFTKYHFASLINICPRLLDTFCQKRPDVKVPLQDLASLDEVHKHIGFVIADIFSFSSPKEINSLFRDLIDMSPFSSEEQKKYDHILHDRHQVVHNASLFTTKYIRTRAKQIPKDRQLPYFYGIQIETSRVIEDADFFLSLAEKNVRASHKVLSSPETWESEEELKMMSHAIGFLEWNENTFIYEDEALD